MGPISRINAGQGTFSVVPRAPVEEHANMPSDLRKRVTLQERDLGSFQSKQEASDVARQWALSAPPSQVKSQGSDGTWQTEWTYGTDSIPPTG